MITSIDVAWAAGFLEGEGWFGRPKSRCSVPAIMVGQVQKEPLEKLQRLFGGGLSLQERANPKWRAVWYWELCGNRAAGVCLTLYGLMSPRRQSQIDAALAQWRVAPKRKIPGIDICVNGHALSPDNVVWGGGGKRPGQRYKRCKICENKRSREARKRRKLNGEQLLAFVDGVKTYGVRLPLPHEHSHANG